MQWTVSSDKKLAGQLAASVGAERIREAISRKGFSTVILATGASQFEMLECLVAAKDIDWSKVTCFHLDEYIGIDQSHGASFVKYLKERFVDQLAEPVREFHFVNGAADPGAECGRLAKLLTNAVEVDVAFIGIGENGHLAFNDPPADFENSSPYIVVDLDEACRKQQLGEGWFPTLDDVPKQAISMSIQQIMASQHLIVTVPDKRKAQAVHDAMTGPVRCELPASILQRHKSCTIFLDLNSASLLTLTS